MEEDMGFELDSLINMIDEKNISIDSCNGTTHQTSDGEKVDIQTDFLSTSKNKELSTTVETSLIHTGDTSSDEEESNCLTESGQQIKKKIKLKPFYENKRKETKTTWTNKIDSSSKITTGSLDSLIGIRIVNPLVSFDVLQQRMQGRKFIKMSFVQNSLKKKDISDDWVTFGVIVKKVPPKTSKNGKIYSIWKLTDLHNPDVIVSLFLFGQVHTEHWKTAVGKTIGLLNPSFMTSDKDGEISFSLDHPGKIMLIGTARDFGNCKATRKNGEACNMIVNLAQCEYCVYHVKSQYKKFSQRSEIQASYSGREPCLKNKILKGPTVFYGGQSFTPLGKPPKKENSFTRKDKITLSNLVLKRKASAVFDEEKSKGVKKLAEMYGKDVSKVIRSESEFINNKLAIPSVGSRNILSHMMKNQISKENNTQILMSAKELLKQHGQAISTMFPTPRKDDTAILNKLVPRLGKGLNPGEQVKLDFSSPKVKTSLTPQDYAKVKAIKKIKELGPIQKKDPNDVKSKPEEKKIKAMLESSFEESSDIPKENEKTLARSKLGYIDLNSEKVQKILSLKSNHSYELEMSEMMKEAAYFARLEKKEQMEEKMISTKEIVCDVVSCRKCRYTAHNASEMCKTQGHPLKCHKAIKRFYACQTCKNRTECFTRFPQKSCSNCGGSKYERTGMKKIRSGPRLDSEVLNICSDSAYFLNSL